MAHTRFIACSCNDTASIAGAGACASIVGVEPDSVSPARELCRREIHRFTNALAGDQQVLVGCTQEAPLFNEVAAARTTVAPVRFVNLRERAAWGVEGAQAGPKISALVAMAAGAVFEPAPAVSFQSSGRSLIVGDGLEALEWAKRLSMQLSVTVLMTGSSDAVLSADRQFPVLSGEQLSLTGWLGEFQARWRQGNPIDLDACVRCGACIEVCPEQAISDDFQVDLSRCSSHRDCVKACGTIGAIDFARSDAVRSEMFDLVFDLREAPAFSQHDRPLGYFFPGRDEAARIDQALKLVQMLGEFEKPRYFQYNPKICSHRRSQIEGCSKCVEVCSTSAITSDGDTIRVEPHLCLGCGGCSTVCPSGALSYVVPKPSELGRRIRIGLAAYRGAGGRDAMLLVHDEQSGRRLLDEVGRGRLLVGGPVSVQPGVRGLPARVIPVEVSHVASFGTDLALAALAFGAAQVCVMVANDCASGYLEALEREFGIAGQIVAALGLGTSRLSVLPVRDAMELETWLHAAAPVPSIASAATFAVSDEKRRTIEFAVEHLAGQARQSGHVHADQVPLSAGAPFGTLNVSAEACTLCKACIGACPQGALLDSPDAPQLRFIERNCVQCGLCVRTCPEQAIELAPRYLISGAARDALVLHEAQPYHCASCGKPFGTQRMVENMLERLGSHSMFSGQASRRLQMCGDCRVSDMFTNKDEMTIHDVSRQG